MNLKTALAGFGGFIVMTATAVAQPSVSSRYDFITLDYPGSLDIPGGNFPLGINNKREVVGFFTDNIGCEHGYLWKQGRFTTIDVPGVPLVTFGGSGAFSINDHGDIAGLLIDKNGFEHGYLRTTPAWCEEEDSKSCKAVFSTIDVPGAAQTTTVNFEFGTGLGTAVVGLNNDRVLTGLYATPGLYSNAFSLHHGVFKPYSHPGASHLMANGTKFFGVSNSGVIAGDYQTQANLKAPQITHAFLLDEDQDMVTPIEAPGSAAGGFGIQVTSVNTSREAIGVFTDSAGAFHGFFWKAGDLFRLDFPGMPFNEVHSINDRGDLTGGYATDAAGTHTHGYIAFPKDR